MRTEPAWTSYPFQTALSWTATFLIVALVVLAAECSPSPAHADSGFYLDLAGGLAILNPTITQEDGVWHQQAFPHNFDTMAPAFRVGAGYAFNPQWSVQSHWFHLGTARVSAYHVDDRDYDAQSHRCTGAYNGPSICASPGHLDARDTYQGADLTVTRTFAIGPVRPFLKVGGAILYHHFRVETDALAKFSQFGWIPALEIGGGLYHGPFYFEVDYIKGIGGPNSGCLGHSCGWPVSKEQIVTWVGIKIPLGS